MGTFKPKFYNFSDKNLSPTLKTKMLRAQNLIEKLNYDIKKLKKLGYKFIGRSSGWGAYAKNGIVIKSCLITQDKINSRYLLPSITILVKRSGGNIDYRDNMYICIQPLCRTGVDEEWFETIYSNFCDKIGDDYYFDLDVQRYNSGIFKKKMYLFDW